MLSAMSDTEDTRPTRAYHHGDLSRALIDAARRLLEKEGAQALSLRAVAREAGVSPAAPYHHFIDKNALLDAVATGGWTALSETVATAARTAEGDDTLTAIGSAYVAFARDNPALYQLMYQRIRNKEALPTAYAGGAYDSVKKAVRRRAGQAVSGVDLELATFAVWCSLHGLAEMRVFPRLEGLKTGLGGEEAFVRSVLDHLGVFTAGRTAPPAP
jgi:AcrR family transcriptional regulator